MYVCMYIHIYIYIYIQVRDYQPGALAAGRLRRILSISIICNM